MAPLVNSFCVTAINYRLSAILLNLRMNLKTFLEAFVSKLVNTNLVSHIRSVSKCCFLMFGILSALAFGSILVIVSKIRKVVSLLDFSTTLTLLLTLVLLCGMFYKLLLI